MGGTGQNGVVLEPVHLSEQGPKRRRFGPCSLKNKNSFHPAPFSALFQPETTAIFCPSLFRAGEVKKKKKKKKKNRGKIGEK